jgi:hypothetical protein
MNRAHKVQVQNVTNDKRCDHQKLGTGKRETPLNDTNCDEAVMTMKKWNKVEGVSGLRNQSIILA